MSPSGLAGSLRVAARWQAGALGGWQVQLVRPPVARALVGLEPALALARIPLYFSLCSHAQREAGRLALAAAGWVGAAPVPSWQLWAECLHEHLWRLLLDWPRLMGEAPRAQAFAAWRAARHSRDTLVEATRQVSAALPAQGEAADRRAAFAAAARALQDDLPYPWGSDGSPAAGQGEAWVHTARGRLRHGLQLADGRVARWQVDAPTDRNFADERGIVERLPASLPSIEAARRAVERAVLLLDPCVPYTVEIVDA